MEWPVVLALILVVPLILFPVVLIWFLNFKGIQDAVTQRKWEVIKTMRKRGKTAVAILIPLAIYGVAIWYSLGHFGWQVVLAVALVLPIVLFVPVIVWAAVASGLADVLRDRIRRRAVAPRRRVAPATVEEPK